MAYPLPNNVTTVGDYMEFVVSIDPNFFNVFLFGFFLILFIGLRASPNIGTAVAWATCSMITFLCAVLLLVGGYIGSASLLYLVGAVVIGIILLMREVGG
jgi:hypothetical protein